MRFLYLAHVQTYMDVVFSTLPPLNGLLPSICASVSASSSWPIYGRDHERNTFVLVLGLLLLLC